MVSELGYEIFLRDGTQGEKLWEHLMAVVGSGPEARSYIKHSSDRGWHVILPR